MSTLNATLNDVELIGICQRGLRHACEGDRGRHCGFARVTTAQYSQRDSQRDPEHTKATGCASEFSRVR